MSTGTKPPDDREHDEVLEDIYAHAERQRAVQGLSVSEKLVYFVLKREQRAMTTTALRDETRLSTRTVTDSLRTLTENNLVKTAPYIPDGRRKLYYVPTS